MAPQPTEIAKQLVEEIIAGVHRRFTARQGVLVPPPVKGRHAVPSERVGETVVDLVDQFLESDEADWPETADPEIYLDLVRRGKHWSIDWVVDSADVDSASDSAAGEPE